MLKQFIFFNLRHKWKFQKIPTSLGLLLNLIRTAIGPGFCFRGHFKTILLIIGMTLGIWRLSAVCIIFFKFFIPSLVREPAAPLVDKQMTQAALHNPFEYFSKPHFDCILRLQHIIMTFWTLFLLTLHYLIRYWRTW